jgi:hypothetical protein
MADTVTAEIMNEVRGEQFERRVSQLAESKISETLAKHGVTREQLKTEVINDAYTFAREKLEAEREQASNPYFLENQRLREELRIAKMQTAALRDSKQPVPDEGEKVEITIAKAQARVGTGEWNHGLSDAGRLSAVGIDPASVTSATKKEIMEVFGPRSDPHYASNLRKVDPAKYRRLKLAGKVLRLV